MKIISRLFLSVALVFTFCYGQTEISGVIAQNTTWGPNESPVHVVGNTIVNESIELIVEPGVEVLFDSGISLIVNGEITAIGEEYNPIIFKNSNDGENWGRIVIYDGDVLRNCIIQYGGSGNDEMILSSGIMDSCIVIYSVTSGISNSGTISNSTISNNGGYGVSGEIGIVLNSQIADNGSGGISGSSWNSDFKIEGNLIEHNQGDGIAGAVKLVQDNILFSNTGYGISMDGISNMTITKNQVIANSSGGIRLADDGSTASYNVIANNTGGYAYHGKDCCMGKLTNSTIYNNANDSYIMYLSNYGGQKDFNNNTIAGNSSNIDIFLNNGCCGGTTRLLNNNIFGSGSDGVVTLDYDNTVTISAENNYWGTNLSSTIQENVIDFFDDGSLGIINYLPYLTTPNADAPISPPKNVIKQISGDEVLVSWDANEEGDLSGYRLYYGNYSGYSYEHCINVGNVTEFQLTGVNIDSSISITAYDMGYSGNDDKVNGNESWYSIAQPPPLPPTNISSQYGGDFEINLSWNPSTSASIVKYLIYRDITEDPTTLIDSTNGQTVFNDSGLVHGQEYHYRIRAVNIGNVKSNFSSETSLLLTRAINVPSDYSTIQAGLNTANLGDTVLVQPGTYTENIIWPETNGIKLLSVGDSSNTIIDGGGVSSVIYMNPQSATIDTTTLIQGFKITNGGNVSFGGGMFISNAHPTISVTVISGNTSNEHGGGIYISGNPIINKSSVLSNNAMSSGGGLYIDGSPTINNSTILSNYSGGNGGGAWIQGGGSSFNNVTVANNEALPYGDGGGIHNYNSSSTFSGLELYENKAWAAGGIYLHGGGTITNAIISHNSATNQGGGLQVEGGTIQESIIINNTSANGGGIWMGSYSSISNSTISDNNATNGGGIYFASGSSSSSLQGIILNRNIGENGSAIYNHTGSFDLQNSTITNHYNNSIYIGEHNPSLSNNNFLNNDYGLFNADNSNITSANNNYWGHSSGPYHPSQNPTGQGDSTNQWVNVTPWLTTPNTDAPPIPAQHVSVSGTGDDFVSLNWDASLLGDFAGFKLYYDTDESGYPYENSVDIGSNTSHALSGLNLGTEYFLAVTVYDTDGNESWYSNEVTGVTRVMEVQYLDIAGDEDLFHLITHAPLITFDYFDSMGETQTNYHVQISTDSTFQSNLIWDSAEVASDATSIQYTEGALLDGVKYYLRTKVASGSFWSDWTNISFGMNTEPTIPVQVSLINDEVTTSDVLLEISNSSDAEGDNLSYEFRLYDATQAIQLDSAIAVVQDPDGTEWEVLTALDDNAQHWWTVQAYDGYEYSELAGPESFLINFENDDPAGYDLTSPLLDEAIITQAPLFTWDPAIDPDPLDTVRYVLYLETPDPGIETFYPGIDTSFQLTYDLDDNTSYHWKVVARDLNDSETESNGGYQSFIVNTSNDLPEYFELLYPVWDEMVTNLSPEFLWEASSDPDDETIVMRSSGKGKRPQVNLPGSGNTVQVITGYDFYLSMDSMLTDVVPVEVVGTYYSPVEDLLENQTYYWAVSALDDSGGVTFSDTASFWTNADNEAPEEFALLLPTEGEVLTVLSPTFTWESSSDPDLYDGFGYHILLGSSPEDMDTLWSGEDTTLILDWELTDNTTYYWAVFAEDWSGLVTHNTEGYQSFTINQGNDAPSMVELITPDSVMVLTLTPEMYWTAALDADPGDIVSYEMHWWGDGIEFDSVLTDTNAAFVTSELEDNTQYFWEVIAMDQTDGISHSEAATFWTDLVAEAPGAFALLSPEDDMAGLSDMPSFEWEPSDDPDPMDFAAYTIQIATDSNFVDVVFDANTDVDVAHEMTEALPADTEYWWRVVATDTDSLTTESETFKFTVGYVSIAEAIALPTEYLLDQNYPNPFNPSTTIKYGLPEDSNVSLVIYDIRGNTVRTIDSGSQVAGWYEHVWNGMNDEGQPVSTGLYLTRLRAGSYTKTIKMLYLK